MTSQEKNKDNPIKNIFLRIKPVFSSLLVFIVVLGLFFYVDVSEYRKIAILNKQRDLILDNIKSKNEIFAKVKKYNVENSSLRVTDLEKFKKILPESNMLEEYLAMIGKISDASESRAIISNISIKETKNVDLSVYGRTIKLKKGEFSFSIRSSFSNFSNFIDSLEKDIPLISIDKIEIHRVKAEDQVGFINSNISVSFYFL